MKLQKAPPPVADINVTPMVDVMLVLLIIFMVITPMLTKGQPIDLVRTHNPVTMQAADKEDAVLISVTRNGGVFLSPGNLRITPDQLHGHHAFNTARSGSIGASTARQAETTSSRSGSNGGDYHRQR